MISNDILSKKDYISPIRFHTGRIIEYDIKSANINVLYHEGALDDEKYHYLSSLPKMDREIAVGMMMRQDSTLYRTLIDGILKFRYSLIKSNDIQEKEIVRLATDAIYVNRFSNLKYTKFDNVEFLPKNEYSNMTILLDLIILSKYVDNTIDIDVKGLGNVSNLHQQYMLSMIANAIFLLDRVSVEDALKYVSNMYVDYTNRRLPIGFYRELNTESCYTIPMYNNMKVSELQDISLVDIGYNIQYFRELYNIIFERFH